jgi:putative membrane protein
MKYIAILTSVFLVLIAVQIYAVEHDATRATPEKADLMLGKHAAEAEILAYLVAINEAEIAAAQDALTKNVDARVTKFAEHMNKDHSKNLEDTQKLAQSMDVQPQDTEMVMRFREKAAGIRTDLSRLDAGAFANAYMDYMVRDHQKALEMIDQNFMKNAKDVQLLDHLKVTRSTVADHYSQAKSILDDLKEVH